MSRARPQAAIDVSAPLLEACALGLQAGGRRLADGLSVVVRRGECWAVLGPNGAGKTTLLLALAGLATPAAGNVRLAGRPIGDWTPSEAACLRGLVPQQVHDAFPAGVLDLVLLGRHPHLGRWGWEDEADRTIARAALAAVDLAGFEARDVLTLSGGERQRVAIAALLAQEPLAMLLDEPVSHLDLHHQVTVLGALAAQARERGRAVVMSLHDLGLARRFATHALLLGGGTHHAGPVDEVLSEDRLAAAYGHRVRRAEVDGQVVYVPL
ncbi:MAG: ABC transporter ATP-binding protein [Rubrivivax sp.]|nr:ABC transporter ATP-binding protein [Rubrivivax sp.]